MFAQTSSDLLRNFRAEVADDVAPYLWEDWEAFGYMTEGFDALLKDAAVRYTVLRLPFTAAVPTIPLPKSVLHIRSAHVVGGGTLTAASSTDRTFVRADDYGQSVSSADSMFSSSGTPVYYIRDYDRCALRLVPIPNVTGEIEMQVSSTIALPMGDGVPLPTTDAEDLRLVLHYMKSLAYRKQNAETQDLVRARDHEAEYRAGAVVRDARLRNYRRPPGVVRMSGWN